MSVRPRTVICHMRKRKNRQQEQSSPGSLPADLAAAAPHFLSIHPAELFAEKRGCQLVKYKQIKCVRILTDRSGNSRGAPRAVDAGTLRAVNASHPKFKEILAYEPKEGKKRVHVLAIGDVGSMLLTGLHLLGGDVISSIGICDISDKVTARWEFEENQIAYPWDYDAMPEVDVVAPDHLFDCDVFVFVASKGIPPVGSGVKDVRMYQFDNNSKIIGHYAKMARERNFKGLFFSLTHPGNPLAKTAFLESNKNEAGEYDWMGLLPEQVQGFGLGVMNARAAYYAKRDPRFKQFLTEGRSFRTARTGPCHCGFHRKLTTMSSQRTDKPHGHREPSHARHRLQTVCRTGILFRRDLDLNDVEKTVALRIRLPRRRLHGREEPLYGIRA